jgi:hypothetical protein
VYECALAVNADDVKHRHGQVAQHVPVAVPEVETDDAQNEDW